MRFPFSTKRLLLITLSFGLVSNAGTGLVRSHFLETDDVATKQAVRDRIVVEALTRLPSVDVNANDELKQTVLRYIDSLGDDPKQIEIARKLRLSGLTDRLLSKAMEWGMSTSSVQAVELIAQQEGLELIKRKLCDASPTEETFTLARIVSLSNKREFLQLQEELLSGQEASKFVRSEAVVALARNTAYHPKLVELVRAGKIPDDTKMLLGPTLRTSENEEVRKAAQELFPASSANAREMPSVQQLVKQRGNVQEGKNLYFGVATCSQCHTVGTEGKNVGPSLTEIGSKLTKEAMYVSILSPSAGISHNYESFAVRTKDDEIVVGLMVSNTDQAITLRDAKGIDFTFAKEDIDELKKQEKSLMPENLHELFSDQGLVDLVEYLTTLKKQ
ncbi:c-type cytochrome [Pirellulaceae bacterium SH449]